ncbi:MAG TPA: sodium:solute symporter family protein [Candidatus Acidoferrales bacterium]|nr:sodium:solute symporter family protein [Candidatus Acidoferrales bacterium]
MITLTPLDWFWILAFIVLMIGCGIVFYRLGKRSQADFFLAGRGLPWWLPAASVFATHTATDTPMWVAGVIYEKGLSGIWFVTLFSAWCAISAIVSSRIFRRSLAYSQAEWQSLRFGELGSELMRGWMTGWAIFLNMFILGWVGMAMGKVCQLIWGWPTWYGLVLFSSVCAVYVLAAGYWGVIITDFQQGVIAFASIVMVSIWGIVAAGGPAQIIAKLHSTGQSWRLDIFHFTGMFSGDFPIAWFITMLLFAILGGVGMATTIDWYAEAQRIQSAKTVRDASYGLWTGTALILVRDSLWAIAILGFFTLYPNIQDRAVYEIGWFQMGFLYLPVGMVGFFFATILAIHFSTISSHLNLGALYATRDLYQHYVNPQASEKRLVWVGRLSTLGLLLGSFLMGSMMQEITRWLIFALWLMAAGVWLPNLLQVVWWRFNAWGFLAAWIANLGTSWLVVWVLPAYGVLPQLPDYIQFWLLMALGTIVFLPITLLTPPENMDHLVKFYVMTRPVGWWGPVRREAERRGLLEPKPKRDPALGFIRRRWTPDSANRWSREDFIAAVFSALGYLFIIVGGTLSLLGSKIGYVTLGLGIASSAFMYWVIDPKLRAVSADYEEQQKKHLERLESITRWEKQ